MNSNIKCQYCTTNCDCIPVIVPSKLERIEEYVLAILKRHENDNGIPTSGLREEVHAKKILELILA